MTTLLVWRTHLSLFGDIYGEKVEAEVGFDGPRSRGVLHDLQEHGPRLVDVREHGGEARLHHCVDGFRVRQQGVGPAQWKR